LISFFTIEDALTWYDSAETVTRLDALVL